MDRVLDRLWIGAAEDLRSPLGATGFSGLLDLRDGGGGPVSLGVCVKYIDNRDGDPWSKAQVIAGIEFVAERIARGKVLVACAAGMSRSACMVIGYLVRAGHDAPTAYELVRRARPKILPVPKMLESVLAAVLPESLRNAERKI